jgi:Alpha/beta hydrolase family
MIYAAAEALNSARKKERTERERPWRGVGDVMGALRWAAWHNTERLYSAHGYVPRKEPRERYNADLESTVSQSHPAIERFQRSQGPRYLGEARGIVHGAWADGSSWSDVIGRLQASRYRVTAPQFPLTSLSDDVARLRQVLDLQDGPTVVAGHSYGGQIITALGSNTGNAVGLVYIAAFRIDEGESPRALLSQGPPFPALAHLSTDKQGFGWLPQDDYVTTSPPMSTRSAPESCTPPCRR